MMNKMAIPFCSLSCLDLHERCWWPLAACVGLCYLFAVRLVRNHNQASLHAQFSGRKWKQDMSVPEAQAVMHASMVWDMPSLLFYAVTFAGLRTLGIPTVSKIFSQSKELVSGPQIAKRIIDTALAADAWSICPISSTATPSAFYLKQTNADPYTTTVQDPRAFIGIARTNWLHAHYRITNDDFLYTLAVLTIEPIRWAREFGWRPLSPLEEHARFVFHRRLGELMGIHSIPDALEEMMAWAEEYEATHMEPSDTSAELAPIVLNELASSLPFGRSFLRGCIATMLPKHVLYAMSLPEPTCVQRFVVWALLRISAFSQKHLLLPRCKPPPLLIDLNVSAASTDGHAARMHPGWTFNSTPWYVARPRGLSLLLENALLRLGLKNKETVPGQQYECAGARLEEIGPVKWKNLGHEKVFRDAEAMMGCSARGLWARIPADGTGAK